MSTLDASFVRRQFALLQLEQGGTMALQNAVDDDNSIVSLAFTVTFSGDGLVVLEGEFRDRAGNALGGFGL